MTDEQCLLAAIIAKPESDTPRLVYADWLEDNSGTVICDYCGGSGKDRQPALIKVPRGTFVYKGPLGRCPKCDGNKSVPNGRSERAEFIRLGVDLATIRRCLWARRSDGSKYNNEFGRICPRIPSPCFYCEQRQSFEKRIAELLRTNIANWWPWFDYCLVEIRNVARGFIEEVGIGWKNWLAHHAEIRASTPLRKVRLTGMPSFAREREFWATVFINDHGKYESARWPGIKFEIIGEERPWPRNATREDYEDAMRLGALGAVASEADVRAILGLPPNSE